MKDDKAKEKKKQGELDTTEPYSATVPKGSAGRREPVKGGGTTSKKDTKGILTETK